MVREGKEGSREYLARILHFPGTTQGDASIEYEREIEGPQKVNKQAWRCL